jgi:nucleotide-binding universal stress UspA family protein
VVKKILVPTDGSEPAQSGVKYAAKLAKALKAEVVTFYVMDKSEYMPHLKVDEKIYERLYQEQKEALDKAEEICKSEGVVYYEEIAHGYPFEEIGKRVQEDGDIIMVVMGATGKDYLSKRMLGSVTLEVVKDVSLKLPCPVVVVPNEKTIKGARLKI